MHTQVESNLILNEKAKLNLAICEKLIIVEVNESQFERWN